MSFGKFGARPRGMGNPTYWVSSYLQDQRRQAARRRTLNRFDEKWGRLNSIYENLRDNFLSPLNGREASQADQDKIATIFYATKEMRESISDRINDCGMADLSKYATSLKKLAIAALLLCKKLSVYDDIDSVSYNSASKSIYLNGESIYFLG